MAVCAARNPYLHDVLVEGEIQGFPKLYEQVRQEGTKIIPNVVAYAMTLNNLDKAMRKDITLVEAARDLWIERQKSVSLFGSSGFGWFEWGKLLLIDYIMKEKIQTIKSQNLDPNYACITLPLNILEAILADAIDGNFNNAWAGLILAKNRPRGRLDTATGSGPAEFSSDKQATILHMPFEKQWADLYATWNLGFVSRYEVFPYLMTKLLIPQVNDYQQKPGEYIHNRMLALYATLNFFCFAKPEKGDVHFSSFDWKSEELIKLFGIINARNAQKYQKDVNTARLSKKQGKKF